MQTSIDRQRLELVLGRLLTAMRAEQHPYRHFDLPQDHHFVERSFPFGTREHAFWLFVMCFYMRGGFPSNRLAVSLGRLRRRHPEYFRAELAAQADPLAMTQALEAVGLNYMKYRLPPNWIDNSRRMAERWDGDPRKMLAGITDYNEAYARIMNDKKGGGFWGFQEKISSMLLYLLIDEELIEPFLFPPPVDFHTLRVCGATRIIRTRVSPIGRDMLSDRLLAQLRKHLLAYCVEHKATPIEVANAFWLLSSLLCSKTPGNRMHQGKYSGRKTELTIHIPDWDNPAEVRRWLLSCGLCPLEDVCSFNFSQATYYRSGQHIALRRRAKPPKRLRQIA